MKKIFLGAFAILVLSSCSKSEENNTTKTEVAEQELVQKPLEFKNAAGEAISVTYYSEDDVVAVKIEIAGEGAQNMVAKTVNHSGNPIFTNEEFMWEIVKDGQAGKLSDKSGKTTEYIQSPQAD